MAYTEGFVVSENQRWIGKRKAEVVMDIIKGKVGLVDFCRAKDLKQLSLRNGWTQNLKSNPKDHSWSSIYQEPKQRRRYRLNESLVSVIRAIIDQMSQVGVETVHPEPETERQREYKGGYRIMIVNCWLMKKKSQRYNAAG